MPFDGTGYGYSGLALEKIDRVIALLATSDKWCQGRMQTRDGRRCILGAMRAAHAEIILAVPICQAIHEVAGRTYSHIEQFNDHRTTSHALVLQVLHQARESIRAAVMEAGQPIARHR